MIKTPEGYREVTELAEMQALLRDLFKQFHELCEKHGLIYNMFGGTFLGAVRHQNIIPWDDDVDVTMPRGDYEKLVAIVKQEYTDCFGIMDDADENYIYPFGKFYKKDTLLIETSLKEKYAKSALYIDIFPMDGAPDMPEKLLTKRYKDAEKNKRRTIACVIKNRASDCWWKKPFVLAKKLYATVLNMWGYKFFLQKQIEETKKYDYDACEHIGFISSWGWGRKGIISKEDYLQRRLYKFGEYSFWGTEDYHSSLSNWYGDYMTPPPENKRVAVHGYKLYIKD